ncbi:hypothetical protein KR222_004589 [Zaprionus bogoriensis]|nr:hypothetical protein KR222_004589 [Zaprionus bogoriensis]
MISMPLTCLCSGIFAQLLGKRLAMQLINIPTVIAWLFFYYATCTEHMYVALCLVGIGGGLMEAPVITYVAEISDPKYRGMFSALATTFVSLGVFTQFALGSVLHWRTAALVSTTVPIFSVVMLCFVPESPVWLIRERRFIDAIKALQWLRGWVPAPKVEAEFKQLYDELITQKESEENIKQSEAAPSLFVQSLKKKLHMWRKRTFLVPFFLVMHTFFVAHFSGKTPLRTYAVPIFDTLRIPMDKYHATILLGVSEFLATIVGVALINSTGKRPLVFSSMLGTGVCILGIAIYAHSFGLTELTGLAIKTEKLHDAAHLVKENLELAHNISLTVTSIPEVLVSSEPAQGFGFLSWLPLILVLCAAFSANLGVRMMPWLLIGEVFPADIRNTASGFAACMGYLFNFLANKLFLVMLSVMTFPGTFAFYASVSLVSIVILFFVLPETEGCTLGEIEAHFSKKSDVNLMHRRSKRNVKNADRENAELGTLECNPLTR